MTSIRKVAFARSVGTAIEWYDFLIYGMAAALVFNRVFFPEFEPAFGRLAALATFGAGSLARPFGPAVFGHIGDTHGRKSMLIVTPCHVGLRARSIHTAWLLCQLATNARACWVAAGQLHFPGVLVPCSTRRSA